MCTLTYVPLKNQRVVTANRDESPVRSARVLRRYLTADDQQYFIAAEPVHGGTNIALGQNGRHCVLLNGAFEPHDMSLTYGLSRGIVVLKSLDFNNAFEFADQFDFKKENIQPFTLIDFSDSIRELRWDGDSVFKKEYSVNEPHIWASAQMYSAEARQNRLAWFKHLLKKDVNASDILDFHFYAGNGDPENDLVMNRGGVVCTVSITQVSEIEDSKAIKHFDLVSGTESDYKFE